MRSLLGEAWIAASLLLAALAVLTESVWLFGVGAMVLGTGGAARVWARLSLEDVRYFRTVTTPRAFVGEFIDVELHLANDKRLPVPWIELRETLPEALPVDTRTRPSGIPAVVALDRSASLRGGEQVRWPLRFTAAHRGFYRLGPATLRSGDLFGLFDSDRTVAADASLVVYPRTIPLPDLPLPSARPFGEQRGGNRLFEDPVYFRGLRDYLPGDSLKRIDWKASARVGRPQSRVYESSHTPAVVVALNVSTLEHTWQGHDPILLERAIVVAASVAREAFDARSAVGLIANGAFADADRAIRLGAGRSPDQLVRLLEALAMVTPFASGPLSGELQRHGEALPVGATVVVVTAVIPEDLAAALLRLRADGHTVLVLRTQHAEPGSGLPGIRSQDLTTELERMEVEWAAEAAAAVAASATPSPRDVVSTPSRAPRRSAGDPQEPSPSDAAAPPARPMEPPPLSAEGEYWQRRAQDAADGAPNGDAPNDAAPPNDDAPDGGGSPR